jgi:hypothetical protein
VTCPSLSWYIPAQPPPGTSVLRPLDLAGDYIDLNLSEYLSKVAVQGIPIPYRRTAGRDIIAIEYIIIREIEKAESPNNHDLVNPTSTVYTSSVEIVNAC